MNNRPNFVFILADDLGYADLGCFGGRANPSCSPSIDQMAAEGLLFTDGYSNAPVCSPTRFALMTGRFQYRLRAGNDEPIASRHRGNATLGCPLASDIAVDLARCGVSHGACRQVAPRFLAAFRPAQERIRRVFRSDEGGVDYFTHRDSAGVHDLFDGEQERERTGYLTDLISDGAVEFIGRQRGTPSPFLLSVHYTAPHWPWETRADEAEARRIARIVHTDGGSVAPYLTMVRPMDEGIERILAALKEAGVDDNTLVVFTSDNGGERYSDTWPLVGKKMDLLEGGIRVPYVVRWPARVKSGGITSQLAITMDWTATFFEAAGAQAHPDYPLDGMSLLPVLERLDQPLERELFWRMKYRAQKALRQRNWKYLCIEDNEFLFNLADDSRERANQGKRDPERLAAMRARYAAWEATMPRIPDDATWSLPYGKTDLAQPGSV